MRRDGRVTLVDPLPADPLDQPLDRLGRDVQVGQFGQIAGRLLVRDAVDPGVDDLLLHARAEARVVKAQRLVLRGKKPADSGGSCRRVASRPRPPAWSSARGVRRGPCGPAPRRAGIRPAPPRASRRPAPGRCSRSVAGRSRPPGRRRWLPIPRTWCLGAGRRDRLRAPVPERSGPSGSETRFRIVAASLPMFAVLSKLQARRPESHRLRSTR